MENVIDRGEAADAEPASVTGGASGDRPSVPVPVWLKIVAAVVGPLVAVTVLAAAQVLRAQENVRQVDEQTSLAAVALAPGGLFDALIIERGDAAVTVVGAREGTGLHTADFAESTRESDAAIGDLRRAVEAGGPRVEEAYGKAFESLEALERLRATTHENSEEVDFGNMGLAHELYVGYSEVLDELTEAGGQLGSEISDPEMRAAAGVLGGVNELHDAISDITYNVVIAVSVRGLDDTTSRDHVVLVTDGYRSALEHLATLPGDPWAEQVAAFAEFEPYRSVLEMADAALVGDPIDVQAFIDLTPRVDDRDDPPLGTSQAIANAADRALQERIDQLRSDAAAEQQRYLVIAVAVVLAAALVALLVARSITKPMMGLARQAHDMATRGLPDAVRQVLETPPGSAVVAPDVAPVEVSSRDETQVVAAALNEVQLSAVDLAVQQATLRQKTADSLVDLGRRTQNLIGLQLELITELENDEADPAALAHLYRLDHLATRARRNAESLVVLAGTDPPSNDGPPTSISDVVRAALSEVEDYQRVQVAQMDEAHVTSGLAVDLVHLLAELLENGVLFSPPDRPVAVTGTLDDRGYVVAIVDHGIGMSQAQLDEANRRLASTQAFAAAPSRHLGHHVAGRLAARVGAQVRVSAGAAGGTIARVHIPKDRLTTPLEGPVASPPASQVPTETIPVPLVRRADTGQDPVGTPAAPVVRSVAAPVPRASRSADDDGDLHGYRVDGRPPDAPGDPATTGAGLTRRVKGANGPSSGTAIQPIRPVQVDDGARAAPPPAPARRADEVASMLTSFTGAVEQGREDAARARSAHSPDAEGSAPSKEDPAWPS